MTATVATLETAPVKGMRTLASEELELMAHGVPGDRAFLVVDPDGKLLESTRTPTLMQVGARWDPDGGVLALHFPDGEIAAAPEPGEPATTANYAGRPVRGRLVHGPLADALSEHLGRRVALLARDAEEMGADDSPVTLMSLASVRALAAALDGAVPDPRRFRMTITIEGVDAWAEYGWSGGMLDVGAARLRVEGRVPRCVVTTRDPDSGRRDVPTLKALATLRGPKDVTFGVYCEVVRPGRVRVGDPVAPAD